jgi:proteasome lid subunit RPN8/RPN11
MLKLSAELADWIRAHAAESYPEECCGALLGRDGVECREALEPLALANRREDSRRTRFVITPADFRAAEQAARERRLVLIGWYHSHPDHPAEPSEYDLEHAWPWYSYVIVSVEQGEPKLLTAWRLAEDRSQFEPEEIS